MAWVQKVCHRLTLGGVHSVNDGLRDDLQCSWPVNSMAC